MRFEIGVHVAVCVSFLLVACFVGFLYLIPARIRRLSRDDSLHVVWRFAAVGLCCALSPVVLYGFADLVRVGLLCTRAFFLLVHFFQDAEGPSFFTWLGFPSSVDALLAHLAATG